MCLDVINVLCSSGAVLIVESIACQVDGRQDPAFLEGDATTRALMMTDEVGDKVGFTHE